MTFDVIGKTGFGCDFQSLTNPDEIKKHLDATISGLFRPLGFFLGAWVNKLPLKSNRDVVTSSEISKQYIREVIQKRIQEEKHDSTDLLDLILANHDIQLSTHQNFK